MPGRHYVLAFSGGLDTSYALAVLVDRGERVTTVTVNTGGFPPEELREIEQRSQELGADAHVVIDGRARLYDQFVSYILKANYLRNGVYPSCVGVERMLQAEEVTRVALQRGADAIARPGHGARIALAVILADGVDGLRSRGDHRRKRGHGFDARSSTCRSVAGQEHRTQKNSDGGSQCQRIIGLDPIKK